MINHAEPVSDPVVGESAGFPVKTSLTKRDSVHSNFNQAKNKTGTDTDGRAVATTPGCENEAPGPRIEKVWREVVDFGEPCSGTGEDGWGRKRVSVARVSILDGPPRRENPSPDKAEE